jgi:hypothetical protein
MEYLTLHVLLLAAISTVATAYNTWTVTHYVEEHTFTAQTNSAPCSPSTQTVVEDSSTAYFTQTECPLFESISFQAAVIEVTPTTPLQGISTSTITNVLSGYGESFTVYDVNIQLSPNEIAVPSTTPTPSAAVTGSVEPTTNADGYWEINNTTMEFLQPVLFTPPASCKPGTDTSIYTTLTHSSYSFTSLVSLEYINSDIVSLVVAAATSTATTTSTEAESTVTVIEYVVPSDMFPVPYTQPSYYSAMDIDPCVDPRATQVTGATTATGSPKSDARRNISYQQVFIPAVLVVGAVSGEQCH